MKEHVHAQIGSAILLLSLAFVCPLAAQKRHVVTPGSRTIAIGALLTITGDGSTLGNASAAALELAARDINSEMEALRLPYRVVTTVEDTAHIPSAALQKMTLLGNEGVDYVIGPQSSAEAAAVIDYANAHRIVLVSQGSTASALALPGDYLFRLAPNDKLEGAAMAALIRAGGFDTVVPIWRDDPGNNGLHDATKKSFEAAGGSVAPGVQYDPATADFSSAVASLGAAVRSVKAAKPAAKIAIYIASFDEAAGILDRARLDTDLAALRWYAGDGVVQSQALLASASVAAFAASVMFTAPNAGLDDSARDVWQPISDEIQSRVGFTPDAYALSVYDAAWVMALSFVEAQGAGELLRDSFVRNVQRYSGLTGSTALDANGDRKAGAFDFWTVQDGKWVRTGQYVGGHVSP